MAPDERSRLQLAEAAKAAFGDDAGITLMDRRRFLTWSAVGAVLWVFSILLLGFFLGTTFPWLRDRIDLVILAILLFSAIPVAIEWFRQPANLARYKPDAYNL